jgi:hypothetical protein
MNKLTDFAKGVIAGAVASTIIFSVVFAFWFFHRRDREVIEYVEKQIEIEAVREDYRNRDPALFLEVPGVRGAADTAAREFERKRDEALQRFRSGLAD